MFKKNAIFFFSLLVPIITNASSWNFVKTFPNNEIAVFFDSESVEMQGEIRYVWYKIVRKYSPDKDGAWAVASKYKINCREKNYSVISVSDYDKQNKFIKSYQGSAQTRFPAPDSLGDEIINISCRRNFPYETDDNSPYGKINGNDIFDFTRFLKEYESTKSDRAPI